ncbi:MAG: sodium:calcium antiporter [Patescibacteria group bacterium]|nr:MAG: sodium:calcium antiporter [Patescibacteria group bacterium]
MAEVLLNLILLFVASFVVYKASGFFVQSLANLSKRTRISKIFLAAFFVGIATSLPETIVSIISTVEGYPALAIGNALGSNIANLSLIIPLIVLIVNKDLKVDLESFSFRHSLFVLTATVLPFALILDRSLSLMDAFFLIVMFFLYSSYIFYYKKNKVGVFSFLNKIKDLFVEQHFWKDIFVFLFSLFTLILGSYVIVRLAEVLSRQLSLGFLEVGALLVAVGTSLPEFFVGLSAFRKKESDIVFGEILGSLVTNANLVVGLSALRTQVVLIDLTSYTLMTMFLFFVMILFYIFSLTQRKLQRSEAVMLLVVYALFVFLIRLV